MLCSQIEKAGLTESQVIEVWQKRLLDGIELATESGEPVKVIYPGRTNDGRGADFRDAVIAIGQRVVKGDIEVHVRSSEWRAHQHHRDPAYNRVVLHVVMWDDTEGSTGLQNGRTIPVVALNEYVEGPVSQLNEACSPGIPCVRTVEHAATGTIAGILDTAGRERFWAKAGRFQDDLAQTEAGQCLYQGIMGALGYSKNKLPCLELAHRVQLRILESITQTEIVDEECLTRQQALLLGTAGLLPSQRHNGHKTYKSNDMWVDKLERLWASSHQTEAMSADSWELCKVRPINFPVRRIAAISYLVLRYKETGILDGLVGGVKEASLGKDGISLEEGLRVSATGYWACHFDFGLPSRGRLPNLLGGGRAADIVVNVLLPLTVAWGKLNSQPELVRKAITLYQGYPKLAENAVERHMKNQLGLSSAVVNSAMRQQGLLHVYNSLCTQGGCDYCPLGGAGV